MLFHLESFVRPSGDPAHGRDEHGAFGLPEQEARQAGVLLPALDIPEEKLRLQRNRKWSFHRMHNCILSAGYLLIIIFRTVIASQGSQNMVYQIAAKTELLTSQAFLWYWEIGQRRAETNINYLTTFNEL